MKKRDRYWLLFIFAATLITRLILAFSIPNFTYESYFNLRQVEHIASTGQPLYSDPLSYGGRELRFLPFFHYFMALFALLLPLEIAAKIAPNILFASITVIVYFISRKITADDTAPLFAALTAGFLPILFSTNAFTAESLFIPLIFLAIYCFLNIHDRKFLYLFVLIFLLLCLTSSATILMIIGFSLYFLLSLIEGKKINREEIEVALFSLFFYLWVQLLFFKDVFLQEGIAFIWQNIPSRIIQQYFPTFSIIEALILVSVIPFIAGIFVVYDSLFELKNQRSFLLISFAISTTVLAWTRVIQFKLSLAFFGVILSILFAMFYQEALLFIRKTKMDRFLHYFPHLIAGAILLTTMYPAVNAALQQDTPSDFEIQAFQWIAGNLPGNSRILALLQEGHLLTYYGQKRNLMDDQFRQVLDAEGRFIDLHLLFTTKFQTLAISLLNKYKIDYIMFTPHAQKKFNQNNFPYLSIDCFERVYKEEKEEAKEETITEKGMLEQEIKIYRVKCALG